MPCPFPLEGWWSEKRNENGNRYIVFKVSEALTDRPVTVPCGQCISCRLQKSKEWAIRCMHEAQMHDENCFITLTFSPEHLEKRENPFTVDKRDFQLFMKRLRKRFPDKKIRYYHCGEYGDNHGRPHYHACLFGFDFPDKTLWKVDKKTGSQLYVSDILQELWPYGYSTIGAVTFESAAYVARYIMKKAKGKHKDQVDPETGLKPYELWDSETGEIIEIEPEYTTMSLKPAIGKEWYEKYGDHTRDNDYVNVRGYKHKPPKYYDHLFEADFPEQFKKVKRKRLTKAREKDKIDLKRAIQMDRYVRCQVNKLKRNHDK